MTPLTDLCFDRYPVGGDASTGVFSGGNDFKMVRIDTSPVTAEVINLETGRDRPFDQDVRSAMSGNYSAIHRDFAVARSFYVRLPLPALIRGASINL
jgi:hypothetical protein